MSRPRTATLEELLGRPPSVAERAGAPQTLYTEGPVRAPPLLRRPAVAVVGTRRPSAAGAAEARGLSAWLAQNGTTVVSGLAEGIDTTAHKTAIRAGGKTAAVLGTPLDMQYPASNKRLRIEIATNHLVVSQYAAGSQTTPGNFVARNRTIALISDAAVIVEAGKHSGTVHVAREAVRLGRPLYACGPLARAPPGWLVNMLDNGDASVLGKYGDAFGGLLRAAPGHGRRRAAE